MRITYNVDINDEMLNQMAGVLELDHEQIKEYAMLYILQHGVEDWVDEMTRVCQTADDRPIPDNIIEGKFGEIKQD